MELDPSLVWLGLALLLGAAALVLGGHFFFVDLAVAALLMAVLTAVYPDLPGTVQIAVYFGAVAVTMPAFAWAMARLTRARRARLVGSATDYWGREAVVERRGHGIAVRVGGELFRAVAVDGGPLEPGERVCIERLEGITAMVRRSR